jgi:hypothetical protein
VWKWDEEGVRFSRRCNDASGTVVSAAGEASKPQRTAFDTKVARECAADGRTFVMSGTLARARIKPIAHIVPSSRIVGLTVERTFLKRILLRDAVPVLEDEIIPL